MKSIITSSYSVYFNQTAFNELNRHLSETNYSKVFILVDENTKKHCLPLYLQNSKGGKDMKVLEILSGERHKNIATCTTLWQGLSDLDADRKSLLINLGGGVITDLGGFVASTFKRGIAFINIPTTLLSMVDASVGGKTGVDLGSLKNQIGVINQPEMVLVVPHFLKTLGQLQLRSGYAEMLKHGLIQSRHYWDQLRLMTDYNAMDSLIYESVVIKNKIVLEDPTEQNMRKILNFGHTLGHAVESSFLENPERASLLHGEAIAIGMILEAYLSYKLTGLPKNELVEIASTFTKRFGKVAFTDGDVANVLSLLKFDKKNSHGNINFVLLESIGKPVIDVKIPAHMFNEAFAYYKEL
jgi:3-dehydroquinate synthase